MEIFNKIDQVLTVDLTKDFKLKKIFDAGAEEITFIDQLKKTSICHLGKNVHFSQSYIASLIEGAVHSCPSVYKAQSTKYKAQEL